LLPWSSLSGRFAVEISLNRRLVELGFEGEVRSLFCNKGEQYES
jgi:hypothetical protein